MRNYFASAALTVLAIASTPVAHAAEPAVTATSAAILSGRVFDASGSALPGARVVVPSLRAEATTNLRGEFSLPLAITGAVDVEVEYLGRPTVRRTVAAGERAGVVDFVVPAASGEVAELVVTASILDNTARALNQQRQAEGTITVLSADAIGRFPDPNIAEAMQRVSGVGIQRDQGEGRYVNVRGAPAEFSAISVDGVALAAVDPSTRAIDLDTIPSDIVANIEVSKTLLPRQSADSIAGAINITPRSPFDARGFSLNASAGGSYNDFGGNDTRGSLAVSQLFGAGQQFGVLLSGSYSQTNRKPENFENVWDVLDRPEGGEVFGVTETLFKDYDTKRTRLGLTGALEYRPNADHRLYVRGTYSQFKDDEYRNQLGILWSEGALQRGATDTTGTYANTRIEKQSRHRVQKNEISTIVAGGESRFGEIEWDYNASYTKSKQTYPNRDELLWRSSLRPTLSYDFANSSQPSYSLFNSKEHLNEAAFAFRENAYRSNSTDNEELSLGSEVRVPVMLGERVANLSFGAAYRDRDITTDEERKRDRRASANPGVTMASMLSEKTSSNYDYLLGRKFDRDQVDRYADRTKAASERRMPQSITADYDASEKVLAGFAMAEMTFGETNVIAGVRVENTKFDASAPTFNETTGAIGVAKASKDYTEWFPNLTVRHAFTPELIGRFALSRGLNRPNFPEAVPRVVENTDSATVRVELGNPDLDPTLSNNIDAGLEYYLKPLGVLSAHAFYKDLQDYRYTVTRSGQYLGQTAILTRPENAPDGKLYGIEFDWQQQFTFLPGLLGGLGVFANYTLTDAEVTLAQPYAGRSKMPLPGQSKHTYNASVFYERGPLNLRISYTKRSDYLSEVNADNADLDIYWEGRGQVDLTGSYQINTNVSTFFEVKNLTNTAGVRYYGERQRVLEYEKFGYSIFAGVRLKM
ncbi:MAG: TonB-dependent receptor [Phenylobacterium zucineum]|nr:MAG: TonB-dependent receptor [Phenylobacterium zucineum]